VYRLSNVHKVAMNEEIDEAAEMRAYRALEQRARNAAKAAGFAAKKSRNRTPCGDNYGGFMLVNLWNNSIEAGMRFDLSPQDVIDYCRGG
jgi:hypothetical protein